jgi:hypothetical protein
VKLKCLATDSKVLRKFKEGVWWELIINWANGFDNK